MSVPALTPVQKLPVPVLEHPHWRVNYRPSAYVAGKVPTLDECWEILQRTTVRLGGWPFPRIPVRDSDRDYGDGWIAGWSNSSSRVEYWRFYQSTQFLYLGNPREVADPQQMSELRSAMTSNTDSPSDLESVPGFLSITNSVETITKFFEFAARLAQARVYVDPITIDISIKGIAGFMLAAESKWWWTDYVARQAEFRYEKTIAPAELVAAAAEHAIQCAVWLFGRFGWAKPNVDAIRTDQQKLLARGS
ncbi:MAG TPA: hypothetical protein VF266_02810 [Thermoanaerobaculia bacterium]